MHITNASIMDLNALSKLEMISFQKDAWPLFDLIAVLTFPGVIRLKAMVDAQMVGFVAGDPRRRDGWGWIATIAVAPEYRRRGIGRALLYACEDQLGVPCARLTLPAATVGRRGWLALAGCSVVSSSVFQAPQSGHFPTHLLCSPPHCWQTYFVRNLAMSECSSVPCMRPASC